MAYPSTVKNTWLADLEKLKADGLFKEGLAPMIINGERGSPVPNTVCVRDSHSVQLAQVRTSSATGSSARALSLSKPLSSSSATDGTITGLKPAAVFFFGGGDLGAGFVGCFFGCFGLEATDAFILMPSSCTPPEASSST